METKTFIEKGNREGFGKLYLKKATEFALDKSFGKAYEFFKEGLDILTCDCLRSGKGWLISYFNSDKTLFTDINIKHTPHYEYYFTKAYILSYEETKKELYLALDAVDKYLEEVQDEYGHYIKGRILLGLEEYEGALQCFYQAREFSDNERLSYRIGRTKEQFLSEEGVEELYYSYISNPSSICCCRVLKKYSKAREIELNIEPTTTNELILSFMDNEPEWKFQVAFEKLISENTFISEPLSEITPNTSTLTEFISTLKINRHLFVKQDDEYEEDKDYQDYDDYNDHDDYGNDYEKYGGYNGWSDDVIDDAFEGDPENTWNVD